ncbi:hypothetical protein Pcinc_007342 [Petrolisthes cinctipes]|uniref:Gag-like protein n=1 Tax=Petrolisthes cinctipes TaxID=88211 RepID=A0AAE1GB78_PETCI|nr:hypothetical protein Pcinc_007342 [Petrolisthes cinctipes]
MRALKALVIEKFADSVKKQSRSDVVEATVREAVSYAVSSVRESLVSDESAPVGVSWVEVVKKGAKRRGKNLLVVKASNNEEKATDNKKDVATALAGVPIHDSRFTTGGNIVINFDDEATRNEAAERLRTVDKMKVSNVKKILQKFMLCNVSKGEDKDELMAKLLERNECLRCIAGIEQKMKLVFEKPAAGGTVHYIIRCDPEVRASIHRHGDLLKLDWGGYKVRDRYHALVCFYCQRFGHTKVNCTARTNGDKPTCPKCAGELESKECMANFKNCINCLRANRGGERDHTVNEHCCPLLMSELMRVKENTDHGFLK